MLRFLIIFVLFINTFNLSAENIDNDPGISKPEWGKKFMPKRTVPVFQGAFSVRCILIKFPDTDLPAIAEIKKKALNFDGMTPTDYFKEYSQGIAWPEIFIAGEETFPQNVFTAPKPLGYYCEFDYWNNPLGYKDRAEGGKRAAELKDAANKFAAKYALPKEAPGKGGKAHVNCHIYATTVISSMDKWQKMIKPFYGDRKHPWDEKKDICEFYKPKIGWSDPLWPNSSVQVTTESDGGTFVHEIGHVVGAPDFYHAPEKFDGIEGNPCLDCVYGPTGPAYCRYIYNAYLPEKNYPTISKNGQYTIHARKTNPAGEYILGAFVLSTHPHYVYQLEYVSGEKAPLGSPGKKGILVNVINVTMNAPYLGGSPDMCYTYQLNDPWFRGKSQYAFFGKKHNRPSFSMSTEPSSRLPNLLDGGFSFDILEEHEDRVVIDLKVPATQVKGQEYTNSLLPKISLDKIDELLPNSFRAHANVQFRGEPLMTEYGFCWDMTPKPQVRKGNYFPLYHRDRYDGRVLGLRPKVKYFVRAYARNKIGISYSQEELEIILPETAPENVPPLLNDSFDGNWTVLGNFQNRKDNEGEGTVVGSMAVSTLLKLMTYYREGFEPEAPKEKSTVKNRKKSNEQNNEIFDYTRIHTQPTDNRPKFRMVELEKARNYANQIAEATGMYAAGFAKDFDAKFIAAFKLKKPNGYPSAIEPLKAETLNELSPKIIASLQNSEPVVVVQKPKLSTPVQYGLSWVIIDGAKNKSFHLIFPAGQDRQFERKSGWYPLETLLDEVFEAKIIWGLKP